MYQLIQWSEGQVAIQSKGVQVNLAHVNFLFILQVMELEWQN